MKKKIRVIVKKTMLVTIFIFMAIALFGISTRNKATEGLLPQVPDMEMEAKLMNSEVKLQEQTLERKEVPMEKITPVLYVENIESCLGFWVDALGFVKTVELTEGDRLGFVILTSGNTEIMLQTYTSLDNDIPNLGKKMRGAPSVLYIEVKNIDEIERRLKNYEMVVPRRKTSYGAIEIFYESPGGHIIGFAEQESSSTPIKKLKE